MILKGIKKKVAAAVIAGGLVFGTASAAHADTVPVAVEALTSPQNGGYVYGNGGGIVWNSNKTSATYTGKLWDSAADGSGPYLHVYAKYGPTAIQSYARHNTSGNNTQIGGTGSSPTNSRGELDSVEIWVCNGGDINGNNTTNGGCYGRAYLNPYTHNNTILPSKSLGTWNSPTHG